MSAEPVSRQLGDSGNAEVRAALSAHIEELLGLLDFLDGDPDLEPSFSVRDSRDDECEPNHDDELSLGWSGISQVRLGYGSDDSDKTAPERHGRGFIRCANDDHEASLGWLGATTGSGSVTWGGANDDREADSGDEGEPDEDGEPTLGWPNYVGKGAVTITTGWRYQAGGPDGEEESRDQPEFRCAGS